MTRRLRSAFLAAGVAAAAALPAAATAAVDVGDVARKALPPAAGMGAPAPGDGVLVTFSDRPSAAEARARLGDLGTVTGLVPAAGVWRLMPRNPATVLAAAGARRGVVAAEWPLVRRSDARDVPPPPLAAVDPGPISEPFQARQWGLAAARWSPADTGRTPRPTIAILDGGIDRDHPEWSGPDSPLTGGFTAFPGQSDALADDWGLTGHGTHVAGIAAAPANGLGIVGVAPGRATGASVMPVQVADRFGDFSDADLIAGIRFAVQNGARVINISAGGPGAVAAFERTVYWATQRGAVIVAAVGNEGDGSNPVNYPAAYRRVIGVAAQCSADINAACPRAFGVAAYSNRNTTVDITAPGDGIVSTVPSNIDRDLIAPGYGIKDGTSMAAPFVAGAAALLQAANGNRLSPFQVRRQLQNTATDMGSTGRDNRSGYGALNIKAAVTRQVVADDADEVNDEIPYVKGRTPYFLAIGGAPAVIDADIDQFDDPDDVYPIAVRGGARLRLELTARRGRLAIYLWRPGTRTVRTGDANLSRNLVSYRGRDARRQTMVVRVPTSGRYFVNVYARGGQTPYRLTARALP